MIKVYLQNRIFWFDSHAAAAEFMRDNPAATLQELRAYWNSFTRQWEAVS
jgi:hypothetical protein